MSASLPPLPDADNNVTNPVAESAAAIEAQPGGAEVKTLEASCGVDDESDTVTA